jgi:hypothetical protein
MKRVFAFAIFAAVILVSCYKKNNVVPMTTVSFAGKWISTSDTLTTYKNGIVGSVGITFNSSAPNYIQFNSDGTGVANAPGFAGTPLIFNFTVNGKIITINYPAQTVNYYSQPALTQIASIRSQTDKSLQLFYDNSTTSGSVTTRLTDAVNYIK